MLHAVEYRTSNQISGDNEKHVNSDEASRNKRIAQVEENNRKNGKCTKAIDIRPVSG